MRTPQEVSEFEVSLDTVTGGTSVAESSWWPDYLPPEVTPVDSWTYQYIKRAGDLLLATLMILVGVIPGCVIACAILLSSGGGVFYREERIGRNGRLFRIWKFRSMCSDSSGQDGVKQGPVEDLKTEARGRKCLDDPRITAVGSFLRRWSLDELPQLFNVLRGEMSLVGPRPIVQAEVAVYGDRFSYYLKATPGLSGLWQVSGRSLIEYERRAKLDALYVQTWSLGTDISILFQTVPAVLGRIGAF